MDSPDLAQALATAQQCEKLGAATMAPKKEMNSLGSTQPVDDGWRAEVSNVGKGPKRATLAEAIRDLNSAQQANTREEMKTLLGQLRLESRSAQSLTNGDDGAEPVIPLQHVVPEQAAAAADVPPPGTAVRSADDANPGASPPKKTRTGSSNQAL